MISFQNNLLASSDYSSILKHLKSVSYQLKLDPYFGWEKIKINNQEQYFDIDVVTNHIFQLSQRKLLQPQEVRDGKQICQIFIELWTQLEKQISRLNCTASIIYKISHCSRIGYSDDNPEWVAFWQNRGMMLKGSWGIFSAKETLFKR